MKHFRLLIAEDSLCQLEYLQSLCEGMGIKQIQTACNGRVALELIEQHPGFVDVLLCDLEMPDVDGIELIHLLAKNSKAPALVIVSGRELSLLSAVELMARTEGLTVLGVLAKPVQADQLKQMLLAYSGTSRPPGKVIAKTPRQLSGSEIAEALSQKWLQLHYQPKIRMQSGLLNGLEALVRIDHPNYGLLYPGSFIRQCEQADLMEALTCQVILEVTRQLHQWNQQGFAPKVSINLSARSFIKSNFGTDVMTLLKESQLAPSDLLFEVTETEVIGNLGEALAFFNRLRLHGFGLSIDDYGTGYSSVKQLSQIPFTELKMDRSLIDGIAGKPHLQVIFESTLSMCNKLSIELVAEGIESEEDWQYLVKAGCHLAQGYYITPPLPACAVYAWVCAQMPTMADKTADTTSDPLV